MSSVVVRRRTYRHVLAAICVALTLGGALAVREEASGYFRIGSAITRAKQITPGMSVGFSASSMRAALGDCLGAMGRYQSLEMRFETAEVRTSILDNCLATADQIASRAPSLSLAWLTGATAAILLNDIAGFNDRLRRSQLTAPNEQWIADMRVDLAESHFSDLDEQSLAAHLGDLRLMVRSAVGLRSIAARWVRDENFRERIANVVESMPQAVQQRFIANLRSAVRNAP